MPWFLKVGIAVAVVWSGIFEGSYVYWEIKKKNYRGAFVSTIPIVLMLVSFYFFACENFWKII